MKTKPHSIITTTALLCGLSVVSVYGQKGKADGAAGGNAGGNGVNAALIPAEPSGVLSVYPTSVPFDKDKESEPDQHVQLSWSVLLPSNVGDMAKISPPGTITITKKNTYVSVQPIGTGTTDGSEVPPSQQISEARLSVNGGSYTQLFYGSSTDVTPQYSLYVKTHQPGDTLDFGGRYVSNNNWTSFYTTKSNNLQVVTLKNGDSVPTAFPIHTSPTMASYLDPYIDAAGKVSVGPTSVLVLMELGSTDRNKPSFDYQDKVLLVTFSTTHPNNGHGNNLDGVDSSNPGKGVGGPTGLNNTGQDPSGGVDDEGK
jgi:hypothetical protein